MPTLNEIFSQRLELGSDGNYTMPSEPAQDGVVTNLARRRARVAYALWGFIVQAHGGFDGARAYAAADRPDLVGALRCYIDSFADSPEEEQAAMIGVVRVLERDGLQTGFNLPPQQESAPVPASVLQATNRELNACQAPSSNSSSESASSHCTSDQSFLQCFAEAAKKYSGADGNSTEPSTAPPFTPAMFQLIVEIFKEKAVQAITDSDDMSADQP